MNILEYLYYGNLCEYDRRIPNTIKPLQDKIANLHEILKQKLSNEVLKLHKKTNNFKFRIWWERFCAQV